jgi:hypothetical protein
MESWRRKQQWNRRGSSVVKMEILRVSVSCCRKVVVLEFKNGVCVYVGTTYTCIYCLTTSVILSVAFVALLKLSSYFQVTLKRLK